MPRQYAIAGTAGGYTVYIGQLTGICNRIMPNNPASFLSTARFSTYKSWAMGDDLLGFQLYTYNINLSAALYAPLHMFEVTLRNAVDDRLSHQFGVSWFNDIQVLTTSYQQRCIQEARNTLNREKKVETHSRMVAELNLGFWSSLFGRDAHHLWRWLRPAFQAKGIQRPAIAQQLKDVRQLRNRVAHYEPILGLPLAQRYAEVTTITGWLSSDAAGWISRHSMWPQLYPGVPIITTDPTTGIMRYDQAVVPYLPAV